MNEDNHKIYFDLVHSEVVVDTSLEYTYLEYKTIGTF